MSQTLEVLESPESILKEKGVRWKFRTKFSSHRRKMLFAALTGHNTAIVAFPVRVPYKPALSPLHQL